MKKTTLYYIFTFGIGYLIAKKKAKKVASTINTELTVTNKVPFNIDVLIDAIGGKQNYVSNTATINSIKIKVKDISKVNKDKIKSLGAKGVMSGEDQVTCLFGDFSKKLSDLLNEKNINN